MDKTAGKLRRSAERQPGRTTDKEKERREADVEMAEVHNELTRPDHAKGRPPAHDGEPRSSNAGTDAP